MKQNKFMRFMTSRALILTLQVVASGVLLYFVYLTKLLPVKYFAILAAVLAALVLLFWIIILVLEHLVQSPTKWVCVI